MPSAKNHINFKPIDTGKTSFLREISNKYDGQSSKSSNGQASKVSELTPPENFFPAELYDLLPQYFKDCCNHPGIERIEKDLLLISALTICSAAVPNYAGFYDKRPHHPNLYFFLIGPAGSGKGTMGYGRELGQVIHHHKREDYKERLEQYRKDAEKFAAKKNAKGGVTDEPPPVEPKQQFFMIPANNSATGVVEALANNPYGGVIFCTESDTLTDTLKQDWGNYSPMLRAAFHHEPYAYQRRGNKEYVEIDHPKLSLLLSGTPKQLFRLLPDTENGLFSRFGFYTVASDKSMKDVFQDDGADFERRFQDQGKILFEIYTILEGLNKPIIFRFTPSQKKRFHEFFSDLKKDFIENIGDESIATSNRLGLIAFRIAMILNLFRWIEKGFTEIEYVQECNDQDFENSLMIIQTLADHSINIFSMMPIDITAKQEEKIMAIVKLHNEGHSLQQIADQLGYKTKQAVHHWIKKARDSKSRLLR